MPRRNLPPYVQVIRRSGTVAGYRGWWTVGGKRQFGPTRKTADEAHADAIRARGMLEQAPVWGGAFETRAKDWLAALGARLAPDSIDFYRSKLANLYRTIPKTMPVDRITPAVVREFVREARELGLSARTVQHCRRTLNAFFRWMVRRGFVATNPVADVDWPKPEKARPDVFTEAELIDVLARIDDPWAASLGFLIACSGLRRAEVCRLRVADVDAANRVLWVRGKVRNEAQPFAPDADSAMELLLAAATGNEYLIPGSTDRARRNVVAETFRLWQKKLGEPRWHPHALRHSLVTILLRNGVPFPAVQRTARHASYATTEGYAHLVADDVRAGLTRLRLVPKVDDAKHG
jgi:site-specific recombinase XerD